ncbi:hypothetical protein [Aureibacter tunicatorum]|uniref:Uncharacterized protein n=1 Tax=Aureibacter tunicatorum TaxID=866807 RepID=A0AAE4BP16_9BACT|nr:hypothetical protein [Aureibacter tunicatorum]MDR6237444.1 hypothetical protein [Aureibacter tunicatorum]BDD06434.1 hypothetical protein AUTU_39170 [Aureibacter tunicatorum]
METPLFEETEENFKNNNLGIDARFLYSRGIAYLQQLSGSKWTDYNIHDPGVTILEQLCFAITDLTYRTRFDINDHLHDQNNYLNLFLKPEEVFSSNPVTLNDIRKKIFDEVFEVNNVWLEPISEKNSLFNGIYQLMVDIDSNIKDETSKKEIVDKIEAIFHENRNLCEDIEDLNVIDVIPATLHADVEISHNADPEEIFARLLFEIEQSLNPVVKIYSKQELLEEGYSEEQIYEGPLLANGFIKDEELQPKTTKIIISDLIKIIMQIDGITGVKNLNIETEGKKHETQVPIPKNKKLTLINDEVQELTFEKHNVQLSKEGMPQDNLKIANIERQLNEFKSIYKRNIKSTESSEGISSSKDLKNIDKYHSIQEDFPSLYGISHEGPTYPKDLASQGKAKQLKAYLVLYEQIMANFLSQLGSVKKLFSFDDKEQQSYFYQELTNVPNLDQVVNTEDTDEKVYHEMLGGQPIHKNYAKGLKDINNLLDNYIDRKNRLLDFLLGVYGEEQSFNILTQFNYFNEEELAKNIIKNKAELLTNIQYLQSNKSLAFNYTHKKKFPISIFELKLQSLLSLNQEAGFDDKKCFTKSFNEIDIIELSADESEIYKMDMIDRSFDYIDNIDIEPLENGDSATDLLNKFSFFKDKKAPIQALVNGLSLDNYMIGKTEDKKYKVVYQGNENEWWDIGEFDTEKTTNTAVNELTKFFTKFNVHCEGMHLLEHILLRPKNEDTKFGIYILDQNYNKVLYSDKCFSFKERNKIVKELEEELKNPDYYEIESLEDKSLEITFNSKKLNVKFHSIEKYNSVEETYDLKENLFHFLSNEVVIVDYDRKIGFFIQNHKEANRVPEEFYNFRISLVLPAWTHRFSKNEFRNMFAALVQEELPAYVMPHIHWLELDDMIHFEEKYIDWKTELHDKGSATKKFKKLSEELTEFLFENSLGRQ